MSLTSKEMRREFDAMFLDSDPSDLEAIIPKVKVTKLMRDLYLNAHGDYAEDQVVYDWYWSRHSGEKVDAIKEGISSATSNKYQREIKKGVFVDVYDVLKAFNVTNPATQHSIKKLLAGGQRGHKDLLQDLNEAHDSISRAIELELSNSSE